MRVVVSGVPCSVRVERARVVVSGVPAGVKSPVAELSPALHGLPVHCPVGPAAPWQSAAVACPRVAVGGLAAPGPLPHPAATAMRVRDKRQLAENPEQCEECTDCIFTASELIYVHSTIIKIQ